MQSSEISVLSITKVGPAGKTEVSDSLAAEEPLEIRIAYGSFDNRQLQNVSVTMRTPGHDAELATGFLYTEGIITGWKDIAEAGHQFIACAENKENIIKVELTDTLQPNIKKAERNFYTTSSCGVCGKGSINAVRTVADRHRQQNTNYVRTDVVLGLPGKLARHQQVFASTGGLHASALFTNGGDFLLLREDVGRHNALDKLIGAMLREGELPLNQHILLLSGRASFELVQKAVMAGINCIAAVGAPSTLAVQLAAEFGITLIGFLRGERFNIYTSAEMVL